MQTKNYEIDWERPLKEAIDSEEVTLQQQLDLPDEVLALYYKACLKLLEDKNIEDASDGFLFLTQLNPNVPSFWLGYGIAEQTQGRFENAIGAYASGEALDSTNPVFFANAFQCFIGNKQKEAAEQIFQKFLELVGENNEFETLKSDVLKFHEMYQQASPDSQTIPKPLLCVEFEEADQFINDTVESERETFQSKIETFDNYAARKRASLVRDRDELLAHLQNGYNIIIKEIPSISTN